MRIAFQFPTRSKPATAGKITLADAVQQTGIAMFPEQWGLSEAYRKIPYRKIEDQIWKMAYALQDGRYALVQGRKLSVGNQSALRLARQNYQAVCDQLCAAFERHDVATFLYDDSLTRIRRKEGVWRRNGLWLVGTIRHGAGKKPLPILLDEKQFSGWLRKNYPPRTTTKLLAAEAAPVIAENVRGLLAVTPERRLSKYALGLVTSRFLSGKGDLEYLWNALDLAVKHDPPKLSSSGLPRGGPQRRSEALNDAEERSLAEKLEEVFRPTA